MRDVLGGVGEEDRLDQQSVFRVGWEAVAWVVGSFLFFVTLTGVLPLREGFFRFADGHARLGWSLLLVIVALAVAGMRGAYVWITRQRNEIEQRAGEVDALRDEIGEIRDPRRVRADVKIVEEALGDLQEGNQTRDRIVGGYLGPKFFQGVDVQALWLLSDRSPETIKRIHDDELRVAVSRLEQAVQSFHDTTFGNIDSRGPGDPGYGEYILGRTYGADWSEFYELVREVERKGGEIRTALEDVERRLYQLRTDYLT